MFFCLGLKVTYAQYVVFGLSDEYTGFESSPSIEHLGLRIGYSTDHLFFGSKYTNTISENKPFRIQELGLEGKWQFWKTDKHLNCFVSVSATTQIQANKRGTVLEYLNGEPSSFFYRSRLSTSYQFGVSIMVSNIILHASCGTTSRFWQYYIQNNSEILYGYPVWGFIGSVGVSYQLPVKQKPMN